MFYKLNAYLIKLLLNPIDQFGRRFVYFRDMPPIGSLQEDIPYGNHPQQRLDLITPVKDNTSAPLIVYFHGGGWMVGNKASYRRLGAVWSQLGYSFASVNYRLSPQAAWQEQLKDIHAATLLARQLTKTENGPRDLVFAGDSAGGHLAAWYTAATHNPELAGFAGISDLPPAESVKASILIYGAYDMQTTQNSGFIFMDTYLKNLLGPHPSAEVIDKLSPLRHIGPDFPPAYILGIDIDRLYPESLALIRKLDELQVPHQDFLVKKSEYPLARHGFVNVSGLDFAERFLKESSAFLQEFL